MKKEAVKIERVFTKHEATRVDRNPNGPWDWPELASVMISDSYKIFGGQGLVMRTENGDPFAYAVAVNFLEQLYKCGYAVVKTKPGAKP